MTKRDQYFGNRRAPNLANEGWPVPKSWSMEPGQGESPEAFEERRRNIMSIELMERWNKNHDPEDVMTYEKARSIVDGSLKKKEDESQ